MGNIALNAFPGDSHDGKKTSQRGQPQVPNAVVLHWCVSIWIATVPGYDLDVMDFTQGPVLVHLLSPTY